MNFERHTLRICAFYTSLGLGYIVPYSAHAGCVSFYYDNDKKALKNYQNLVSQPDIPQDFAYLHSIFQSMLGVLSKCPDDDVNEFYQSHPNFFTEALLKKFFKKYYRSVFDLLSSIPEHERKEATYNKLLLIIMKYKYNNKDRFINNFVKLAEKTFSEETFRSQAESTQGNILKIFFYDILNAEAIALLQVGLLKLLAISETVYKERFDLLRRLETKEIFSPESQLTKTRGDIADFRKNYETDDAGEVEEVSLQDILEALMLKAIRDTAWLKGSKAIFLKNINEMFQKKNPKHNKVPNPSKPIDPLKPVEPEMLLDPLHISDSSDWKKNTRLFQKIYEAIVGAKKKTNASKNENRYDRSSRRGSYGGGSHGGGSHGGGGRGGGINLKGTGLLGFSIKSAFEEQSEKETKRLGPTSTFLKSSGLHTNASKIKKVTAPKVRQEKPTE